MADNEERLILSVDDSRLTRGINSAAGALEKLSSLTGKTDTELTRLESVAQRAGSKLRDLGASFGTAGSGADAGMRRLRGWSDAAQETISQLMRLERQQRKITDREVGDLELPASLQGRQSGRFLPADVAGLSTDQLQQINTAYRTVGQTLQTVVQDEIRRRQEADRTAQQVVAAIERESRARTQAYSQALAQAQALDQQIAAERDSRRYAGGWGEIGQGVANARNTASRNVATPTGLAAGQQEEYRQTMGAMREYYTQMESGIQKTRLAEAAQQDYNGQLISARYALYDVASTYAAVGTAIAAAGVATVGAFASYESAFTGVERTSGTAGAALEGIRSELMALSTEIPVAFQDLSGIATLGAQMNIAAEDLSGFTEVVAQFSATAGVTTDAAAEGIGRIAQLTGLETTAENFERLGSAILYVGNRSLATEADVLSMTQSIASQASGVGFTTDQIVALAGSLASIGIKPEEARGVLLRVFADISKAAARGGEELQNYAAIAGVSADEFARDWGTEGGSQRLFSSMLAGSDAVGQLTLVMDKLGIVETREQNVLTRLAQNRGIYNQALGDAAGSYLQSTYLAASYSKVVDDLNSRLGMLGNAAMGLLAGIGAAGATYLGPVIDFLTDVLANLTLMTESDAGQFWLRMAFAVGAAVTAFVAYRFAVALATASTAALVSANALLAGAGVKSGIVGLIQLIFGLAGANNTAATAAARLRAALWGVGRATIILGLLMAATELVFNFGGAMQSVAGIVVGFTNLLASSSGAISQYARTLLDLARAIPGLNMTDLSGLELLANNAPAFAAQIQNIGKGFSGWADSLVDVEDASSDVQAQMPAYDDYTAGTLDLTDATDGLSDSLDGAGDSAAAASEEIRTLVDYASDLQGVFSRAFDIRFGSTTALDAITQSFNEMQRASDESAERIRQLRADIKGLTADRSILEYFRDVANQYGDTLRAGEINADLAKINADLAEKNSDLTTEVQKSSKSTKGNSDAAIQNRQALTNLVQQYEDYIVQLAESGMSQEDLAEEVQRLKQDFIQQATQMGYNRGEVNRFALAFDDMAITIGRVPRNVTVRANANPALQALAEFEARARSAARNAANSIRTGGGNGYGIPSVNVPSFEGVGKAAGDNFKRGFRRGANGAFLYADGSGKMNPFGNLSFIAAGGLVKDAPQGPSPLHFARGGIVPGIPPQRKGVDNVPAMLRSREFVITEEATRHYGPEFFHMLNRMQLPRFAAGGTPAGGGSGRGPAVSTMVVELSAYDRHLLAAAGNVQLSIGNEVIAQATNNSNASSFRRGRG